MFTPEFSVASKGEFVLIANHALGSPDQIALSIAYNRARTAFGRLHAPATMQRCRIVYDIRGQTVPEEYIEEIRQNLRDVTLEFIQ